MKRTTQKPLNHYIVSKLKNIENYSRYKPLATIDLFLAVLAELKLIESITAHRAYDGLFWRTRV